jgi:Zn-finger nucleic acid-binding protein
MPQFIFVCPRCREYEVAKDEFLRILPASRQAQVMDAIVEGAKLLKLSFKELCPRCSVDLMQYDAIFSAYKVTESH